MSSTTVSSNALAYDCAFVEISAGELTVVIERVNDNWYAVSARDAGHHPVAEAHWTDHGTQTAALAAADQLAAALTQAAVQVAHQQHRAHTLRVTTGQLTALIEAASTGGFVRVSRATDSRLVHALAEAGLLVVTHERRHLHPGMHLTGGTLTDAGRRWIARHAASQASRAKTPADYLRELEDARRADRLAAITAELAAA